MSDVIGTVSFLSGTAFAFASDGVERELSLGDAVMTGDVVQVRGTSRVEVSLENGETVALNGGQEWIASAGAETAQPSNSGDVIGTVTSVSGQVVAVAADGTERVLLTGDVIRADEVIRTGPDARVELAMEAGRPVVLENGQSWLASSDTYTPADQFDPSEAVSGEDSFSDIDAIQAAILAGQDPTAVGEATAAGAPGAGVGGGTGNEGSSFVTLNRTGEEVDPTAGYGTSGLGDGNPNTINDESLLGNREPVAAPDTFSIDEDTTLTIVAPGVLSNDSDPDGDPLTVVSFTGTGNGSVSLSPDGTLSYTPNPNFNGVDTLTYTVDDGNGATSSTTVTINVNPVNDDPVAVNDAFTTDEDTVLTVAPSGVLANDSDLDGDTLTVSSFTQPANGTVSIGADGSLQYTPNEDFNGVDTLSYTVSDGNGGTASATVSITVNPINDDPDAVDDAFSTDEETALVIAPAGVLANDSDVDGDTLTVTSFTQPANGTVSINGDGALEYTPNENFNGVETLTYSISDGNGGTDTATVTITVNPVNDDPEAVDDSYTTDEDTVLSIAPAGVLANDSDLDGDTLTVSSFTQPANGTVSIGSDGSLQYTPNANFNGVDTLTYTVSDGNGGTDTATVAITVNPINDAPDAVDDAYTTDEDVVLTIVPAGVLSNDSDVDGDTLTVTSFTQPANGSVLLGANGALQYTPDENFNGTDTLTYTISDGNGGSDTATVTITVNPVNDAPEAVDDAYEVAEDTVLTIVPLGVLDNDSDEDGDTLTVSSFTQPANGSVTVGANGALEYTPDENFNGIDTLTYTVSDGNGGTDTATVSITVTPVNDSPDAVDDTYETTEDTPLTVVPAGVLGNDSDPDGDPLTVTGFTQPANGTLAVGSDGSLEYTPNENFNGTETFSYTISDGNGGTDTATVTINVGVVNDQPDAVDDTYDTTEDTPLTIAPVGVLGNDSDPDGDPLTVTSFTQPANGTVTIGSDGSLQYTPDENFNGTDTLTYTISDGNGGSDSATVTINVASVNDTPDAVDDSYTTNEDTVLTIAPVGVLVNDSDPDGDTLTVTSFTQPANGSVTIGSDGALQYTPDQNFNGTDTLTYTISDGNGGSDSATVSITVTPVNDGPDAVNDTYTTSEDTVLTIAPAGVLSNDTDLDGDTLIVTSFTQPANGSVTIGSNGSLQYTPDANFNGTDTLTYTISDGNGGSDTATVTINVTESNDTPDAVNDTYTTNEDTVLNIAPVGVLVNDNDPDGDTLAVTSFTQPANGSVTISSNGSLQYTPDANFNGTDTLTYTISDGNGGSDTATVTIIVNPVNDAPDAVSDSYTTGEDTTLTIAAAGILGNDSDPDGDTLTVSSYTQPANGSVSIGSNGSLQYTPDANFNGTDTLTYTISDGNGGSDTATVTITVNPSNDGPDAVNDNYTTQEDTALIIEPVGVLINDSDPDGDNLTVTSFTQPGNGSVTVGSNGSLQYTPDANYNGSDSFTYTISDGNGGTDTATVNINVTPINDLPTAVSDEYSTTEDTPLSASSVFTRVDGGENLDDHDVEDSPSQFTIVGIRQDANDLSGGSSQQDPSSLTLFTNGGGTVVMNIADGTFTYDPAANFNGTDSFQYQMQDSDGGQSNWATVTLNVGAENDLPVAVDDSYSLSEDGSLSASSVFSKVDSGESQDDHDVEDTASDFTIVGIRQDGQDSTGGALNQAETTLTLTTDGGGTVVMNIADGTFTYDPAANFNGTDSFQYQMQDSDGGQSNWATVTLNVGSVNDLPEFGEMSPLLVDEDDLLLTPVDEATDSGTVTVTDLDGDSVSVNFASSQTLPSGLKTASGDTVSFDASQSTSTKLVAVDESNKTVFTVTLSSTSTGATTTSAAYVFTLYQALMHSGDGEASSTDIGLSFTLEADDGNTPSGSLPTTTLTVDVNDDVPAVLNTSDAQISEALNASVTGDLEVSFGADGFGSLVFSTNVTTTRSDTGATVELKSGGETLTWSLQDTNNDGVDELVGSNSQGAVVTVEALLDTDQYEVTLDQLLDPIQEQVDFEWLAESVSQPTGPLSAFDIEDNQGDIVARLVDYNGGTVNGSSDGFGVDGNTIQANSNEVMKVDFLGAKITSASVSLLEKSTDAVIEVKAFDSDNNQVGSTYTVDFSTITAGTHEATVAASGGDTISYLTVAGINGNSKVIGVSADGYTDVDVEGVDLGISGHITDADGDYATPVASSEFDMDVTVLLDNNTNPAE